MVTGHRGNLRGARHRSRRVQRPCPQRPSDRPNLLADNSLARGVLGWAPQHNLVSGLRRALEIHWQPSYTESVKRLDRRLELGGRAIGQALVEGIELGCCALTSIVQ